MGDQDMEEEEDDLYGTSAPERAYNGAPGQAVQSNGDAAKAADGDEDEDLEEGEEEESDSESDIEIVTERADLAEPTTSSRYQKPSSDPAPSKETPSHQPSAPKQPTTIRITADTQPQPQATTKPILLPGDKYPALRTSTIDLDHVPLWNGKPVTELDLDADIAEQMKPWRRPGADQSDYFNYGFDEFTWATYCMKQSQMAGVLNQQKEENKMFEQMMGGMAGGGMPGMPTGPAQQQQQQQQQAGGMGGMPGEQEMQQMFMQAMQAQGVNDPSQVDVGAMMAQFAGGAGGMPGGGMPQGVPTGPGGAPTGPGGGQQWQGQQQGYQQQPGGRGGRGRRGQW